MKMLSFVVVALLGGLIGFATSQWLDTPPDKRPVLPASRSKTTVPDDFVPTGVEGQMRDVLLVPDALERTARLATLFRALGPEALDPVRAAYDGVLLDLGDTELVLFGEWWARFDPRAAMLWTQQTWSARQSVPVLRAVMRAWGRSDPLAAMAAANNAPDGRLRRRWIEAVLRGWDESVHDGALSYAESLGPGADRQWALYVVTRRRVLRDGPEAAIAWAEALSDDDALFKLNAFRRVASAAAAVDPAAATAFAERHLDGPYAAGVPQRLAMSWVEHDPEAAFRWLATLPPGKNRDDAVREAYLHWARFDPPRAREWLMSVEREPWLDGAIAVHAKALVRSDPVAAIQLAEQIHSESIRNPALGVVARHWLVQDEAAANAWLEQSGLPPEFQAKIRVVPSAVRDWYENQ